MEVSAPRRRFRFRLSTVLILTAILAWAMAIPYETWRYIDGSTGDTWTRYYPSPGHIYPAIVLAAFLIWKFARAVIERRRRQIVAKTAARE